VMNRDDFRSGPAKPLMPRKTAEQYPPLFWRGLSVSDRFSWRDRRFRVSGLGCRGESCRFFAVSRTIPQAV